jgi:hypothetical protein
MYDKSKKSGNYTVIFFGRNSFKNDRTRAVEFPPLNLVEYRPSWPKFFQTVQISPNRHRKHQPWVEFRPNWTIFDQIGGGNSTARVRPFLNEFQPKKNYCVRKIPILKFPPHGDIDL